MAMTAPPPQPSTSASTAFRPLSTTQQRTPQLAQPRPGLRTPSNRKTIYDRNLNRTRTAELSRASFAYLFGEMITYAQRRVTGIQDLERRYLYLPDTGWPSIAVPSLYGYKLGNLVCNR